MLSHAKTLRSNSKATKNKKAVHCNLSERLGLTQFIVLSLLLAAAGKHLNKRRDIKKVCYAIHVEIRFRSKTVRANA